MVLKATSAGQTVAPKKAAAPKAAAAAPKAAAVAPKAAAVAPRPAVVAPRPAAPRVRQSCTRCRKHKAITLLPLYNMHSQGVVGIQSVCSQCAVSVH